MSIARLFIFLHLAYVICALKQLPKGNSFQHRNRLKLTPVDYVNQLQNIIDVNHPMDSFSLLLNGVTPIDSNPAPNVADDFIIQVEESSVQTFFTSFTSRIIGTLIGNVLAGVAFKIIYDKVDELLSDKAKAATSIRESAPTITISKFVLYSFVGENVIYSN